MVKFLHTILGASLLLASTIDARFGDRLLDEDTANDGATIMKLLEIVHPAAKTLVDIAKSQVCLLG